MMTLTSFRIGTPNPSWITVTERCKSLSVVWLTSPNEFVMSCEIQDEHAANKHLPISFGLPYGATPYHVELRFLKNDRHLYIFFL